MNLEQAITWYFKKEVPCTECKKSFKRSELIMPGQICCECARERAAKREAKREKEKEAVKIRKGLVSGVPRFSTATVTGSVWFPTTQSIPDQMRGNTTYPVLGVTPTSEVEQMKAKYEAEIASLKSRLDEGQAVEVKPDILVSGRKFRLIDGENSDK